MSEDAGNAAPAGDGAQQQAHGPDGTQGAGNGDGSHDGKTAGPKPGQDDRSAESMLADAIGREGEGDEGGSGDGDGSDGDAAAELKAAKAEAARYKDLARKQEQRAKANAEKAKNYDAYTESQKTEQQKLTERAAQAEQRAAEAEGRYHRTLAAAQYDLPVSMIDQLGDGTEDEINDRAEKLAAAINERAAQIAAAQAQQQAAQQQPRNGGFWTTGRPVESLRPGALPASDNKPRTSEQWLRDQISKR